MPENSHLSEQGHKTTLVCEHNCSYFCRLPVVRPEKQIAFCCLFVFLFDRTQDLRYVGFTFLPFIKHKGLYLDYALCYV